MPLESLSLEDYLLGMCFFFHKSVLIKGDFFAGGVLSSSDTKGLLSMQEVDQRRRMGGNEFFSFFVQETD